ncbi:3-oxoacyl-[acyl-carrier-protein] synthase III C-terminal domain-containing protein [Streptomyces marianii]|uniref:3-oxoacyl-[acyl-carrier-protein] synthase III C-terminal domain-containing protein n=1 Tax=Streptomyces marianii TaxID=1817406 RepID=UPI001F458E4D|nr:3-oxoacyl-[acyl-carrier-protein] synthase III C-terminal domain-containing protein [Streptomyces marianii]
MLREICGYWPENSLPAREFLQRSGFPESRIKLYERYFGFSRIRVSEEDDTTRQLLAAARGLAGLRGNGHRVRYVLQGRTMPVGAPYPHSTVHQVRDALGLHGAHAFCVTQHACASGLLAVELAGRLLAADGDPQALALVLTGEKVFTEGARVIPDTGVMGESAAAVLVGLSGPGDRLLGYATQTCGAFEDGMDMTQEAAEAFQEVYPKVLADVIRSALAGAGLAIGDIDLILPHNVNRLSWIPVLRELGMRGADRLFTENIAEIGHCFGADPFLNHVSAREAGRLIPGSRYVMTAVGLGATFSAMAFEHGK